MPCHTFRHYKSVLAMSLAFNYFNIYFCVLIIFDYLLFCSLFHFFTFSCVYTILFCGIFFCGTHEKWSDRIQMCHLFLADRVHFRMKFLFDLLIIKKCLRNRVVELVTTAIICDPGEYKAGFSFCLFFLWSHTQQNATNITNLRNSIIKSRKKNKKFN